jgi:hypothetical protein
MLKTDLDSPSRNAIVPSFPDNPDEGMRWRRRQRRGNVRKLRIVGAALLFAGLALPAGAQQLAGQPDAKSFLTGVDPAQMTKVKVDTGRAMRANSLTKALQPNATQRSTRVAGVNRAFPKLTLGAWPPRLPAFLTKAPAAQTPPTTFPRGVNTISPRK